MADFWSAWVAHQMERLTLAQVMISRFMNSSPTSGSVLSAHIFSLPSCSAPTLLGHALTLSLNK